jgi:hypothetical protein
VSLHQVAAKQPALLRAWLSASASCTPTGEGWRPRAGQVGRHAAGLLGVEAVVQSTCDSRCSACRMHAVHAARCLQRCVALLVVIFLVCHSSNRAA